MMAVVYVGYKLQDGPKDAQNGHDGEGQRYGHLCMKNPQRAVWRWFHLKLSSHGTIFSSQWESPGVHTAQLARIGCSRYLLRCQFHGKYVAAVRKPLVLISAVKVVTWPCYVQLKYFNLQKKKMTQLQMGSTSGSQLHRLC